MQMEKIEVLLEQLVLEFAHRNRFHAKSPEFENVTPSAWRKQVNAACVQLAKELDELIERYAISLHEGDFLK